MKAKAWRLYGASDLRLEDVELEPAGIEGVVVEIVANSVCVSDYKSVTLGAAHKRVPDDVAANPIIPGHEMVGIVREVGEKWKDRFYVGQRVGIQPTLNVPGARTRHGDRLLLAFGRRLCDSCVSAVHCDGDGMSSSI